jgi:hypothetical protein
MLEHIPLQFLLATKIRQLKATGLQGIIFGKAGIAAQAGCPAKLPRSGRYRLIHIPLGINP